MLSTSHSHASRRPAEGRTRTAITVRPAAPSRRFERAAVALLIVVHCALATWGALRQSVTFDENYHLPAGVLAITRGDMSISAVNPPLAKMLAGAAALAAGAEVPPAPLGPGSEQERWSWAFQRANAGRFHHVYFAARLVNVLLSALLAAYVWRWSRRSWGASGALVSLGLFALAPEALAHAGVVTMDAPTALALVATLFHWQAFVRTGRTRDAAWSAAALAFALLVRFTCVLLVPLLVAGLVFEQWRRRARGPARAWIALALVLVAALFALNAGYLFHGSFAPLRSLPLESPPFRALAVRAPWLRLPLPAAYLKGLDEQSLDFRDGRIPTFFAGRLYAKAPLRYFPVALAVKWPIGFLLAVLVLGVYLLRHPVRARRILWPLTIAATIFFSVACVGRLGVGVRYLYPLVPSLAIAAGALASARPGDSAAWRWLAIGLVLAEGVECATQAPYHLGFFNALAGGTRQVQWLVNDSNLDWGQGLIALRDELKARGITRVHLAYHGTTEPGLYGIEYVPYLGGEPGPESDWLAVSSYYFVGLTQCMMTPAGRTEAPVQMDFQPLWGRIPEATPAGCMFLFKIR